MAREVTNCQDGFLNDTRYLIMDRDPKFTSEFRELLEGEGVNCVRLPPRSPNLNPHQERFMKSIKTEMLLRLIFFGEGMLRRAVNRYLAYYHQARNHQGLDNRIIEPGPEVGRTDGDIKCEETLGGLLKYYYRDAA